jgi:cholesterol transport system auxiliary component
MRRFNLITTISIFICSITACVGLDKTKQNLAVYDFGLPIQNEINQKITSKIQLETPIAVESLNHNKILYRLNYQNPLRIFFYTESRWAVTPAELLTSNISKMVNLIKTSSNCSLQLKVEAFDQVFQTITSSEGVVQLSASIIEKKSKRIITSQLITERVTSLSPNAPGGTAALRLASENALKIAIEWGNTIADKNEYCQ